MRPSQKKRESNYPKVQETCSYNCSKSILPLIYLLAIFHHGMFFPSPSVSSFSLNHHCRRWKQRLGACRAKAKTELDTSVPTIEVSCAACTPIGTTCWEWSPTKKKAYSRENMSGNPLKGTIFNRKYIWKTHWFSGDHVCDLGEVETFSNHFQGAKVLKEYWMLSLSIWNGICQLLEAANPFPPKAAFRAKAKMSEASVPGEGFPDAHPNSVGVMSDLATTLFIEKGICSPNRCNHQINDWMIVFFGKYNHMHVRYYEYLYRNEWKPCFIPTQKPGN